MQKLIITLIVLLFTCSAQGQTPFDQLVKPKSIRLLEQFVNRTDEVHSDTTAYWHYLRTLAPGKYREGVIRLNVFKRNKNDPNRATVNDYSIHLLAKGDHIFYYQVCEKQCDTSYEAEDCYFKPLYEFRDPKVYSRMQQSFWSFFGSDIDTSELFLINFPFGILCGMGGTVTEGKQAIDSMLRLKDRAGILNWLHSPNTEKQLYATFGLLELEKQGVSLSRSERKKIRFVFRKKGSINICSFCLYGIAPIREALQLYQEASQTETEEPE